MREPTDDEVTLAYFECRLLSLVADAAREGVVLEIRLTPTQPLRMGGYKMQPQPVRFVRKMAE
jgi:hypothetical protein